MLRCVLALAIALAAVTGLAAQPAPVEVPAVKPPRVWANFEIFVWQYQTNVLRDHESYRSVGLRAFHIDRNDPRAKAFAEESGRPYYVDHLADKGYLHLGNKLDEQILRKKELIERPVSLADPATLDKVKQILRKNVAADRGSQAAAYALDDEVSLGSFVAPSEVDASPSGVSVYREWLQREYRTIDALNRRYGTKYAAFADVAPKSFEAFRGQLVSGKLDKVNLSAWCDWRSAMDTHFADTLAELTREANTLDPHTPVGIVGGQMPSPWGGYDYRKLSCAVQWIEAYDIGSTNEILRSYWDQSRPRTQTFFSSKNAKQDAWFLWYYLCHGNRGVIAWPEGWFADGKVAPHIQDDARTFAEVQGPIGRHILDGRFVHDPIAIYDSHPSVQVGWRSTRPRTAGLGPGEVPAWITPSRPRRTSGPGG
ncbi:MAG: beta-galactosidase [Pirellulales bacterium]